VIDVARIVRLPAGEFSVAPVCTTTGPSTTTSPSRFVFIVTSRIASAQVFVSGSHDVVHDWTCAHAVPAPLHCSTDAPLQRFSLAVQAPVQRPAEHATAHVCEWRYAVPLELQISTAAPLQR